MFGANLGDTNEREIPDVQITEELLADGSFLKKATEICNRNRTKLNFIRLCIILRDSWLWVPCTAVLGETDQEVWNKMILEAAEKDDLDSLVGKELVNQDSIRFVPDILKNGDDFFFPVFTSEEEMGEYGKQFSQIQKHFLETINVARNNENDVKGIVINAFTEPFVIPKEIFSIIEKIDSAVEKNKNEEEEQP